MSAPTDLSAYILYRVQRAPGRWTIDQLAMALGLKPLTIATAVDIGIEVGDIEPHAPHRLALTDVFHDLTIRPTRAAWIEPCHR